jgi:hypothetical protein
LIIQKFSGILRKVFQKYDSRRDGSISFEEFSSALEEFGHSEKDLQSMFEAVVSCQLFPFAILYKYFLSHNALILGFGWLWSD